MDEMAQKCSFVYNQQLFAEEPVTTETTAAESIQEPTKLVEQPVEFTPDKVDDIWSNIDRQEETKVSDSTPDKTEDKIVDKEPQKPPTEGDTKSDFNQVIKFKENGQEVELTLAQLIDRAQKGSNYERKVQEISEKQKAFEVALQQKQAEPPKPEDRIKTLQQQVDEYAEKFSKEYGQPYNPFDPIHQALFMEDRAKKQAEESARKQSQEAQFKEYDTQERRYIDVINQSSTDKNFDKINDFALKSLFALPQKGEEGIAEFEKLYPAYQKIQQRIAYQQNPGKVRVDPFTAQDVDSIAKFMDNSKKDFYAKQFVPKKPETKPTIKTESPGSGDQAPKQFDINKFAQADKETQEKVYEAYYEKMAKG